MSLGSDASMWPLAWPGGSLGGALRNDQLPESDPVAPLGKHLRDPQAAHLSPKGGGGSSPQQEGIITSKKLLPDLLFWNPIKTAMCSLMSSGASAPPTRAGP